MILTFPGMAAQKESETISGNLRWSYKKRMESGEYNCTRTSFGFKFVDGELQIDEEEAVIVREIFDLYLQGYGMQKIVDTLNDKNTKKRYNALIPIKIFAQFIEKSLHKDALAGDLYSAQVGVLPFTDHLRPCIVSPNIQLPYIIGAWENYIKNSYLSILKYVDTENKIIKPDKLSADDLEKIRTGESSVEECIVSKFSFQRPQTIINNFGQLDKKLDVNTVFDKPYKRRKIKLKTSIDNIITLRNQIVHDGFMDVKLTDKDVKRFLDEVEEAANRLYKVFAKNYGFKANFDF